MNDSGRIIELDGAFGEGGGQILRTCLALALITGKPFHLANVRAGRKKPGLQPQHLMSVRAAAKIGQAGLNGASLGSTDLTFTPGPVTPGHFDFPIGTAGATGLVLQTLYLPLALQAASTSTVIITGGTHVSTSPCFHFLDTTWRRYLSAIGIEIALTMKRPGFYPRGGGTLETEVQPCREIRGLILSGPAKVSRADGVSAVAGLPLDIARRQARRAAFRLRDTGLQVEIREETWEGGPGTMLAVTLDTTPAPTLFFGLGARGKPAERVADEAADQVIGYLQRGVGAVDAHSADQVVLPLALASGPSDFPVAEVTQHLTTNIATIRHFLERDIVCMGKVGEPGVVRIGPQV